jgi:cyanophycinase-like exopeptidase
MLLHQFDSRKGYAMSPIGPVALIGSGETSAAGGRVFEAIARRYAPPLRIAILETPAGFEVNSDRVAGRVADFLQRRLAQYTPEIHVIPARQRGTPLGPDNPMLLVPLITAHLIFMGAGSPTYAVRQLRDTPAWGAILARHREGAAVILASAAAIAAGFVALPVYEIYKAGSALHWHEGLDLLGSFGLKLAIVSHWNNASGGDELDTSRCYMGRSRFASLTSMLPQLTTILGIDEHTGLIMDLEKGRGEVLGRGGVTVVRDGREQRFGVRQAIPLASMGTFHQPYENIPLPPELPTPVEAPAQGSSAPPPQEVVALVAQREAARKMQDWAEADNLREKILELGWAIQDAADGPRLVRL